MLLAGGEEKCLPAGQARMQAAAALKQPIAAPDEGPLPLDHHPGSAGIGCRATCAYCSAACRLLHMHMTCCLVIHG